MRCWERQIEWRLTTRVFDLIAASKVGISAFGIGIIAEKAEESCIASAIFTD